MQLGDWAAQQQEELSSTTSEGAGAGSKARQLAGHGVAHPVLLASAAVQAFDYALLNGAHIVLAGWRAGSILDGSSSSGAAEADAAGSAANATASSTGSQRQANCVLGAEAAENINSTSSSACLAAVQRLLFLDALQPLEQAGVLVVTMHPDEAVVSSSGSSSTSTAADDTAAAPVPCSLGLELTNVLCVASAPGEAASSQPLAVGVAPAVFFEELIYDLSDESTPPPASTPDSSSSDNNATDSSSANSTDSTNSGNGNATAHYSNAPDADDDAAPDQETNTITSVAGAGVNPEAGVTRSLLLAPSPVALLVPGKNILGGWAWGGHAAVSGGSAAAAVAAGAAALIWSNLGLTLGAEASGAAAHEGLAQLVKQMLIEGGINSDAGGSSHSSADRSSSGERVSAVARNPLDALRGDGSSNSRRSSSGSSGPGLPKLHLVQTQHLSSAYSGE
jgi:hypothetical protein